MVSQSEAGLREHDASGGDLPRWDLSRLYPGLDSDEFKQEFESLLKAIGTLERDFDRLRVGWGRPLSVDEEVVRNFEQVLSALNSVLTQAESIDAYLSGHVTTDSRDELAQARHSELRQHGVALEKLDTRFVAWVGRFPVDELIAKSPMATAHAFPLRRLHEAATHLMSEDEEALAAELGPSGGAAWSRLHSNLTSQISGIVDVGGKREDLPISAV